MAIVRAKLTGGTPITSEIAVVSCRNFGFFYTFLIVVTNARLVVLFGFFVGLSKFFACAHYLEFNRRDSGRNVVQETVKLEIII